MAILKYLVSHSIIKIALIITILSFPTYSKCYQYQSGDTYPQYNSSYCTPILKWPVSDTVLSTYQTRDAKALAYYTSLYHNYYQQGTVTLDCLGMAKYFFCAKAYPTCTDDVNDQVEAVCDWMCDLFSVRCGEGNQFFQEICVHGGVKDSECSFGGRVRAVVVGMVVVMLLLLC